LIIKENSKTFFSFLQVEVIKLQKHLALLREEYVKLQNKYADLERKHNLLSSIRYKNASIGETSMNGSGGTDQIVEDNYITRLLKTISELFDKDLYRFLLAFFFKAESKRYNSQCFVKLLVI